MSSAAASARGHATCPCCQVCLRAPPTSWSFKHFPGKNEVADVSVSLGTLPRSPATGRRAPTSHRVPRASPTAHAWTRPGPPRPPSLPAAVPPPPSLTAHPSIRDVRALFAAYPKSLTERGTDVSFVPNAPRSRTPCLRDTPRRAPTARWCARHAPRPRSARDDGRSSGSAARTSARAPTWRARCAGAKRREKRVAARRRAARPTGAPRRAEPPSRLRGDATVARPRTRRARRRWRGVAAPATAPAGLLAAGSFAEGRRALANARARRGGRVRARGVFRARGPQDARSRRGGAPRPGDAPVVRRREKREKREQRRARFRRVSGG